MKKLLFLLLPIFAFSQTNFKKMDSIQFVQTVDQLVKDTGKNFVFDSLGETNSTGNFYKYIDDKKNTLLITFNTYFDGRNTDLEINGVKKWEIRTVYGKYLALFPIWKKYFQPEANIEEITKKGFTYGKNRKNYFNKEDDQVWSISL